MVNPAQSLWGLLASRMEACGHRTHEHAQVEEVEDNLSICTFNEIVGGWGEDIVAHSKMNLEESDSKEVAMTTCNSYLKSTSRWR
jgi:hypothetical protein